MSWLTRQILIVHQEGFTSDSIFKQTWLRRFLFTVRFPSDKSTDKGSGIIPCIWSADSGRFSGLFLHEADSCKKKVRPTIPMQKKWFIFMLKFVWVRFRCLTNLTCYCSGCQNQKYILSFIFFRFVKLYFHRNNSFW